MERAKTGNPSRPQCTRRRKVGTPLTIRQGVYWSAEEILLKQVLSSSRVRSTSRRRQGRREKSLRRLFAQSLSVDATGTAQTSTPEHYSLSRDYDSRSPNYNTISTLPLQNNWRAQWLCHLIRLGEPKGFTCNKLV